MFQLPMLKNKSFIPKKNIFFGRSQYQNKKALSTDSIFREGFGDNNEQNQNLCDLHFCAVDLPNYKKCKPWPSSMKEISPESIFFC